MAIDTYTIPGSKLADGFYVLDVFTEDFLGAICSGPFETAEAAEQDRRESNIADDCEIIRVAHSCEQCEREGK